MLRCALLPSRQTPLRTMCKWLFYPRRLDRQLDIPRNAIENWVCLANVDRPLSALKPRLMTVHDRELSPLRAENATLKMPCTL